MSQAVSSERLFCMRHLRMEGAHVILEPLEASHRLAVRAVFDSDALAWELMVHCGAGSAFPAWWSRTLSALAEGRSLIYAVRRRADGDVIGTSGYLAICAEHRRVEIGSTFYHPSARSTAVNPECKYLLLAAAFDAGAHRAEFLTDARNLRSQAALAKLGATREGMLRRHKRTWTGVVRDSVIYAVTDETWPQVKKRLAGRLARVGSDVTGAARKQASSTAGGRGKSDLAGARGKDRRGTQ